MSAKHISENKMVEESDYESVNGNTSQLDNSGNDSESDIHSKDSRHSSNKKKKKKDKDKKKDKTKSKVGNNVEDIEDAEEDIEDIKDAEEDIEDVKDPEENNSDLNQTTSKLNKQQILKCIRSKPDDEQTPHEQSLISVYELIEGDKERHRKLQQILRLFENEAIKGFKKNERQNSSSKTPRTPSGIAKPYYVPDSLKNILDSIDFKDCVAEATPTSSLNAYDADSEQPKITPLQLCGACFNYSSKKNGEDTSKKISLKDTSTPVYSIFAEYIEKLDSGNMEERFKPSKRAQNTDRESLLYQAMLSFSCQYLKWVNCQ